jgi:acarbose 7IV-phosphotransferase
VGDLDVAVVGNVGIDTNVYFRTPGIDFEVEANFTENLDCIGQAGGFVARGYARLGRRTAFIGHVGDDPGGRFIRETFAREGIDTGALGEDPAGTARSVNFMYPDGRRKNFYDGKGHMTLEPDLAACRAVLARARLAHFNIPNWARRLLPLVRAAGATLACDLQDVVDPLDPYRRDFVEAADLLFFSAANHTDPSPLLRAFARPGRIVLCGMGARGCALGTGEGIRFMPPVPFPEPVVDTNGAGDGLAVGFLTSYVLEGRSLEASVLRGQIAARHTCTLKADSSRLIDAQTLERHARRLDPPV